MSIATVKDEIRVGEMDVDVCRDEVESKVPNSRGTSNLVERGEELRLDSHAAIPAGMLCDVVGQGVNVIQRFVSEPVGRSAILRHESRAVL